MSLFVDDAWQRMVVEDAVDDGTEIDESGTKLVVEVGSEVVDGTAVVDELGGEVGGEVVGATEVEVEVVDVVAPVVVGVGQAPMASPWRRCPCR
jgi:hypothetical protein